MQYVVVTPDETIIWGSGPWNAGGIRGALNTVGLSPYLTDQEPDAPMVYPDASVLPCNVVYEQLGPDQCSGDPVDTVGPDAVNRSYPAVPMTADQLAARAAAQSQAIKDSARAALSASDVTMIRCVEAGVAVPAEWRAYRQALRATAASGAGTLPDHPAYPSGT